MQGVRKNPMTWIGAGSQMETFGAIIRAAREAKGLKQREVAHLVEPYMQGAHLWRWEADKNLPNADRLARLIEVLELDPDQIWRIWGEAQVRDREEAVAATVSPVERAVSPAKRNAASGAQPARARAPRARRGTRPPAS